MPRTATLCMHQFLLSVIFRLGQTNIHDMMTGVIFHPHPKFNRVNTNPNTNSNPNPNLKN